jgi:outer membrane murein-binding lipoprotein Lpp
MTGSRTSRIVLIALAVLAAVLVAGCEPLGPDELRREVQTIQSTAAEGSVLADQVAAQNSKRTFTRVQARELSDAAGHSAERLTDAHPADGLEQQTERAISLAEDTSTAIGDVETAPDDAAGAARAADRLRELARQSEQLAASL